ncbi:Isochorismatase family hydrolase [plant metagenome]|uniref:Isochorismatase family hydrolase n=1 Tax=plant metagenome TaxID=1297885 RepID=A0A484SS83_9ZZZZ
MKQALLVIDAQQSFRLRPQWDDALAQPYLLAQQALIDAAEARAVPVVQVLHIDPQASAQAPFARGSDNVRVLDGLQLSPQAVFHKTVHSSLFGRDDQGLGLDDWLRREAIQEVLVSGIRTEQCCETTARHASDSGYGVRFISDATLTFPMQHANGRQYTAQDIRERTELVLAGRFARILSTQDAWQP